MTTRNILNGIFIYILLLLFIFQWYDNVFEYQGKN